MIKVSKYETDEKTGGFVMADMNLISTRRDEAQTYELPSKSNRRNEAKKISS